MAFTEADLLDPDAYQRVREAFAHAAFLRHCGIVLDGLGPGWAETSVPLLPHLMQAQGFAHAGLQATLADHTSGAACGTLVRAEDAVLAVEFKINLLRPGVGERLTCRSEVIRAGRRLIVTEARVHAHREGAQKLIATFSSTVAVVQPGR